MPEWEFSQATDVSNNIHKGILSDPQIITSKEVNLGYAVQYRIYLPSNYENLSNLPVLYVLDGQEYADFYLGKMTIVLDNLIAQKTIIPIMVVFVDSRNPSNLDENRRDREYINNEKFIDFLSNELVPFIDQNYKTSPKALQRSLLGFGAGGLAAIDLGLHKSYVFGMIGAQSPLVDVPTIRKYGKITKLPLKFYISSGTYFDNLENIRLLRDVLIYKGYPLDYKEVSSAPTWSVWRIQLQQVLKNFYRCN